MFNCKRKEVTLEGDKLEVVVDAVLLSWLYVAIDTAILPAKGVGEFPNKYIKNHSTHGISIEYERIRINGIVGLRLSIFYYPFYSRVRVEEQFTFNRFDLLQAIKTVNRITAPS